MKADRRLLISAVCSGAGKTTIAIGIMAVLKKRDLKVQPFKVGPDYIDTNYHEVITGNISYNLDGWMLGKDYIVRRFCEESLNMDVSVIEGVMGLYDGCNGKSDEGSTAQIAKWLKCPVILIVDASSMARSAGAVVYGFEKFDKDVNIAGVIFNKVGSARHFDFLKEAVENNCNAKILGYISRDDEIRIPSRHLGLFTSSKDILTQDFSARLTSVIEKNIDMEMLMEVALSDKIEYMNRNIGHISCRCRIAVAYDDAFCFYYNDNFRIMEGMGISLLFFSPLADSSLPEDIDGVYIGGGYPELFAERLEENNTMRHEIREFAENGGIIYAECGGLMYLSDRVNTVDDKEYEMAGVFPCSSRMLQKRKALGYVSLEIDNDCILGVKGDIFRGHEYHYSCIEDMPDYIEKKYRLKRRGGGEERREGYSYKNVLASYVHLHFGMNVNIVKRLAGLMCSVNMTTCVNG